MLNKKRFAVAFSLIVLALFLLPFISAVVPNAKTALATKGFLDKPINIVWPTTIGQMFGLITPITWGELIIVLAIFTLFFVAFSDILVSFSTFSPPIAWVIGFCLALVVAITKLCLIVASWAIYATAWAGTFSVAVVLISSFVAAALAHLGLSGVAGWLKTRNTAIRGAHGIAKMKAGARAMRDVGDIASHNIIR